jgi:hypothetical protein
MFGYKKQLNINVATSFGLSYTIILQLEIGKK